MADFANLIADKTVIMNKHYTPGRDDNRIRFVVVHINAGRLTTEGCWQVWQQREASAHYQVEYDGTIGQLVWDSDAAWHAGDYTANTQSVGIEHANSTSGPDWGVSDATLDAGAHWVAAICHYYSLGRPQWGVNVFGHNTFYSTECPGALGGRQQAQYMARAQQWYDAMASGGSAASEPPKNRDVAYGEFLRDLANRTIAGEFGNGDTRRERLGQHYAAVQNLVNQMLGENPVVHEQPNLDDLARRTIAGEFGNGQERINALGGNYEAVQARVNAILNENSSVQPAPSHDITALAWEVIAGNYGNGDERVRRLQAIGADYNVVQARVNELLS